MPVANQARAASLAIRSITSFAGFGVTLSFAAGSCAADGLAAGAGRETFAIGAVGAVGAVGALGAVGSGAEAAGEGAGSSGAVGAAGSGATRGGAEGRGAGEIAFGCVAGGFVAGPFDVAGPAGFGATPFGAAGGLPVVVLGVGAAFVAVTGAAPFDAVTGAASKSTAARRTRAITDAERYHPRPPERVASRVTRAHRLRSRLSP